MKKLSCLSLILSVMNFYGADYSRVSLHDPDYRLAVLGIGRLGLCFALACADNNHYDVIGYDINQEYIKALQTQQFSSLEPEVNEYLQEQSKADNFKVTSNLDEALTHGTLIYITVDTPTKPGENEYDHSKVNAVLTEINKRAIRDKHIVIASTVMPGYIKKTAQALIKDCTNTSLSYNPFFIAQGRILCNLRWADRVLIGAGSDEAGRLIHKLHALTNANRNAPVRHMNVESAEIAKLGTNCFIPTKIAYANDIGDIADKTPGADKDKILEAIGDDPRIGHACLLPGYGFGGPCFPRDNRALAAYALSVGVELPISQATDQANKNHTARMALALVAQQHEPFIFENVTFNGGPVPIIEESQKLEVARLIKEFNKDAIVTIRDRAEVIKEVEKKFGTLFEYEIIEPQKKESPFIAQSHFHF